MRETLNIIKSSFITAALAGSLILTGCSALPAPGSLVKPPQGEHVTPKGPAYSQEELAAIVQPFLKDGARLQKPEPLSADEDPAYKPNAVQLGDLTGDGLPEIIAGYRLAASGTQDGAAPPGVGVLVLQEKGDKWTELWRSEELGYQLTRLQPADITGDGAEDLVVGGLIGASAGAGLHILTWDGQKMASLTSTGYHRLEVGDFEGTYGRDGKHELAIWSKDTGDAMAVSVLRWQEGWVEAVDTYQTYFPRVVEYYQERVENAPEAGFYWYYLADAQIKSGNSKDALESIGHGMLLSTAYPDPTRWQLLQAQALIGAGRYQDAVKVCSEVLGKWGTKDQGNAYLRKLRAEITFERGRAYQAAGNLNQARADFQQAHELYTDWDKPVKALEKLDLAAGEKLISDYLAKNPSDAGPEFAEKLMTWASEQTLPGGKKLDLYAVAPVNNLAYGKTTPKVLLTDWTVVGENEQSYPRAHGVYWWMNSQFHSQVQLYAADEDQHGLGQVRLLYAHQDGDKVAAVYDRAAFGSGSPQPALYLWSLKKSAWQLLWRSDIDPAWRASHGQIQFTGPGLTEFTLDSDSWFTGDGKDTIFHESNPGPHRHFTDKWHLEGDTYRLKEAVTNPSAYNTLVEFVYALGMGNDEAAGKLVTDAALVKRARELGLVQQPLGQGWMLALNDMESEQRGPLKILDGPAEGVTVSFTEKDGQWLISAIKR